MRCSVCGPYAPAHVQYFRDGDPFTEAIRTHDWIERIRRDIAISLKAGDLYGKGDLHYGDNRFSPADRADFHWDTLDSALTFGDVGMPLEQAFMGAYDLKWEVVGESGGDKVIEFHLTNASTRASASPNPSKVYSDVYQDRCAGCGADARDGEAWTKQSVRWRETFSGGQAPARPGAWQPESFTGPSAHLRAPIQSVLRAIFGR